MHQTKKSNRWHFAMKAHELLHGQEQTSSQSFMPHTPFMKLTQAFSAMM